MLLEDERPLAGWIDHLFVCVKRHISRYGHRMVQASGTLNQLYVGLEEARRLLRDGTTLEAPTAVSALGLPPVETLTAEIVHTRGQLLAQRGGPLWALSDRFGLSPPQLLLLVAAAGPVLSMDLSRLFTFAWADFAVKLPTVGFLIELIADTPADQAALAAEFLPQSPLVRYRLIELRATAAWGEPTPLMHRGVAVPDTVVAFLRGHLESVAATLEGAGRLTAPEHALPAEAVHLAPGVAEELRTVLARAVEQGRPRPCLVGTLGVGRRTALAMLAAELGLGLLSVDLQRLAADPKQFAVKLAAALREALLRGAVVLLRADGILDDKTVFEEVSVQLGDLVNRHEGALAFTARQPHAGLNVAVDQLHDLFFPLPGTPGQRALWAHVLGGDAPAHAIAQSMAQRFSVSPGTIHDSVADARARQGFLGNRDSRVDAEEVARAVRRRLDHALSQVAEPFSTSLEWEDVILPEEVMTPLREIMAQAKHREKVFDEWGFRRKMSYGRGLGCLFAGPPGTGKTMMAALMAKTLGREIYKVDLSRVVSKWVGETEKNLGKVFDEAERAQVILLFDEADSLFSSRTEVKGSNDRFANMEINYLLQRMEAYDGMSILTTNIEKSIDEAFKRRLKFKVDFEMPEPNERAMLWRVMLPKEVKLADDVRFDELGKRYKLAGGHIKNAVLRAAFYAAEEGKMLDHALLDRAAIAESRDLGRLI